jgi:hypothetical protein
MGNRREPPARGGRGYWHNSCLKEFTCRADGLGDRAPEIGRSLDRREGRPLGGFNTLDERPAIMIQLNVFVPAVIAIYAATGAWVFSSPKPSTLFGEAFYTVGSAFCSCARGFSFFLIDRGSQCFQQATMVRHQPSHAEPIWYNKPN